MKTIQTIVKSLHSQEVADILGIDTSRLDVAGIREDMDESLIERFERENMDTIELLIESL